MSTSYTTEPPPTASVLLHTTAGPLTLSLFAQQTPLTCRNFLQHCLDGTYNGVIFHRIAAGFVIQTGDPTGTGEGGENIFEDDEFEVYDEKWARVTGREKGERIKFGDEVHSRLKFNRRGLVGMAKSEGSSAGGGYGSQFFVTLGDVRPELDGKCTMFGRVEGEGIYNVVKIAGGELVEGTERPIYPEKITSVVVLEMPRGEAWEAMRKRERVSKRVVEDVKKEKPKKKASKALLSFGGDEGDGEDVGVVVRPKKAKFNTSLVEGSIIKDPKPKTNGAESTSKPPPPARRNEHAVSPSTPHKRKASSPPHSKTPSPIHHRTPSFHDTTTQLPLRNEEVPSNSPSPTPPPQTSVSSKAKLESEIAALKELMRRPNMTSTSNTSHKKSALESLIPATSTRGRKRPRPGDSKSSNREDASAMKMLNAFRARLESVDAKDPPPENLNGISKSRSKGNGKEREIDPYAVANGGPDTSSTQPTNDVANDEGPEEETQVCDLHFIANCQSCSNWSSGHPDDDPQADDNGMAARRDPNHDDDDDRTFLSHTLNFAKDRLGKDLNWRKDMRNLSQEDMETRTLAVIDVKEKEREILNRERKKNRSRGTGGGWGGK